MINDELEAEVRRTHKELYQMIENLDPARDEMGKKYDDLLIRYRRSLDNDPVFYGHPSTGMTEEEYQERLNHVRQQIRWSIDEMSNWRVALRRSKGETSKEAKRYQEQELRWAVPSEHDNR